VGALLYPALGCVLGALLLTRLGGMPPAAWDEFARIWPQIPLDYQQGQGGYMTLLLVQAGGWLVAWISVGLMGGLALYHLVQLIRQPVQPRQVERQVRHQQSGTVRPVPSRPPARPALAPTEQARVRPSVPQVPTQPVKRPRVTTRLPEQPSQPQRVQAPAPRPRVTTRLPEQPQVYPVEHPTWYGDAIWNRVAVVGLGPDTPPPVTEPLPVDQIETQKYLYMERLDA
jgi:hypothetical protein